LHLALTLQGTLRARRWRPGEDLHHPACPRFPCRCRSNRNYQLRYLDPREAVESFQRGLLPTTARSSQTLLTSGVYLWPDPLAPRVSAAGPAKFFFRWEQWLAEHDRAPASPPPSTPTSSYLYLAVRATQEDGLVRRPVPELTHLFPIPAEHSERSADALRKRLGRCYRNWGPSFLKVTSSARLFARYQQPDADWPHTQALWKGIPARAWDPVIEGLNDFLSRLRFTASDPGFLGAQKQAAQDDTFRCPGELHWPAPGAFPRIPGSLHPPPNDLNQIMGLRLQRP
jgi:hypothetical protein